MKNGLRILGIDDGPFSKNIDKKTVLVGILMKFNSYIEGITVKKIDIDGTDVNNQIIEMFNGRFNKEINFIMTNGITFGGFNIMDISLINEKTNIPVISVIRKKPDLELIYNALKKHFGDYEYRIDLINKSFPEEIILNNNNLYVNYKGINLTDVKNIIKKTIKMGNMPEPIRMAHLVATAIIKGESYGKV